MADYSDIKDPILFEAVYGFVKSATKTESLVARIVRQLKTGTTSSMAKIMEDAAKETQAFEKFYDRWRFSEVNDHEKKGLTTTL